MQTVCSRCFESYDSMIEGFYYNQKRKRYYLWCKKCDRRIAVGKSKKTRAKKELRPPRLSRPFSSDPVEDKFIRLRKTLVQRNKKHGSETITTRQLIDLYREQDGKCHYTGLAYSIGEKGPLCMTVDRINNAVGYEIGNVVLCCWFVNCAKNEWALEEMKTLWRYLPTK